MKTKLPWITLVKVLLLFSYTFAQPSAKIEYSTAASPDFYKDEKITFTCKATGCTDLKNFQLRYEADGDSTVYRSGCSPSPEDDTLWGSSSAPDIITVPGIEGPGVSNAYCNSVGKPEGFSFPVQLTATDSTLKGKFYCRGFEGGGVGEFLSSEVLMEVKVAPTGISLNKPATTIEGEEFTFDCNSTGADPVSVYEYKVNDISVAGKYTPTETDRGGLTISCTDTEHSNWKGGNTEQTVTVTPQYLAKIPGVQNPIVKEFNPGQPDAKLDCSQHVDANPLPSTFTWTYNGVVTTETSNELTLIPQTDGVTETAECVAENGLPNKVTIKWNITWNNAATIPTTTSTTISTTTTVNKGGLIGGIVGAIVGVIVAVVVSVIVVRKSKVRRAVADEERRFRADAENAKDSKEKSNLAPQPVYTSDGAKKDKRNGNRHSLSKPQTQQKHKDDPIIYADLDLKSQPRALITKPSGDTPADSVLYTSIDHIKTRKLKDQLDEPSIPTTAPPPPPLYGNVTDN